MSAIKQIRMRNIQSHEDTVIDLPETGIVRFYGDNSNGKSVFVKALWDILSGGISRNPAYRRDLIRRGCQSCELTVTLHDGRELFAHVNLEAAQTYTELRRPAHNPVRRYLSDRAAGEIAREFGFHYNPDLKLSVNVHRDDDPLLFTSTPHKTNYALMDSAVSDEFAEKVLGLMQEALPELKKLQKNAESQKLASETGLRSLSLYDAEAEQSRAERLTYLARNLELAAIRPIPKLDPPPRARYIPKQDACPAVYYPNIRRYFTEKPPDIQSTARELRSLRASECPLCGRRFLL